MRHQFFPKQMSRGERFAAAAQGVIPGATVKIVNTGTNVTQD
jgi:hypothetical protein